MKEIIKFDSGWLAKSFCVEFYKDSHQITLTLIRKGITKEFKLLGVLDVSCIGEIMNSHHIEILENYSGQLEFGRFKLGFTQESYIEIFFDKLEERFD